MNKLFRNALVPMVALGLACSDDDDPIQPEPLTATFDVVVANVSTVHDFIGTGVFNTPVGADAPGPLPPGAAYEATFDAPPDGRLSFATMFVQSNDLFYAPDGDGIALYVDGAAVSGDVTDQVLLWDSGTEVNQEPGLGVDQAPRQAGADTGDLDADATVRVADDTFDNLPDASDVLRVTLTPEGAGRFTLRIENTATGMDIPTSDGGSAPFLLAPGVWTVGAGSDPLFTEGEVDRGEGLEALAEDGDPSGLAAALGARTGVTSPIAPGVFAVHSAAVRLFTGGQVDAGLGLEALAEDGNPSGLAAAVSGLAEVSSSGVFNTPSGAAGAAPAFPGDEYSFSFEATAGERLSFATMFVQSNDLFYAPADVGLELFSASGTPLSGDITASVMLWDAGTETNEAPGIGMYQAPRQPGANSGPAEGGLVRLVDDGYTYPMSVIRVTITPRP
jgi:hypothetical protein